MVLSAFAVNLQAYHGDLTFHPQQIPPFIASMDGVADSNQLMRCVAAAFNQEKVRILSDAYFDARESIDLFIPYRFESCNGVRAAYIAGSYLESFVSRPRKTIVHLILPVFLSARTLRSDIRAQRKELGQRIASMFHKVIQWLQVRLYRAGRPYRLKPLEPGRRNCWLNLIFAANVNYHPGLTGSPSLYQIVEDQLNKYGYYNYLLQGSTLVLMPSKRDGNRAILVNENGAIVGGSLIGKRPKNLTPNTIESEVAKAILECGWETILAGATNQADGGVDIIAYRDFGKRKKALLAIQTKATKVVAEHVSRLRGALARDDLPFNMGIIVTNRAITRAAEWEAQRPGAIVRTYKIEELRQLAEWLIEWNPPKNDLMSSPTRIELTEHLSIDLP